MNFLPPVNAGGFIQHIEANQMTEQELMRYALQIVVAFNEIVAIDILDAVSSHTGIEYEKLNNILAQLVDLHNQQV